MISGVQLARLALSRPINVVYDNDNRDPIPPKRVIPRCGCKLVTFELYALRSVLHFRSNIKVATYQTQALARIFSLGAMDREHAMRRTKFRHPSARSPGCTYIQKQYDFGLSGKWLRHMDGSR
ncbi:unnamed protein product [Fusarium graminearum]|nr:unnamed protein product [Fusarium graminearum]